MAIQHQPEDILLCRPVTPGQFAHQIFGFYLYLGQGFRILRDNIFRHQFQLGKLPG